VIIDLSAIDAKVNKLAPAFKFIGGKAFHDKPASSLLQAEAQRRSWRRQGHSSKVVDVDKMFADFDL
jgi:hypothetical protein